MDCIWQVSRGGYLFCRHTKVNSADSLVREDICARCKWANTECSDPRPMSIADAKVQPKFRPLCVHIGDELRQVGCASCSGNKAIKVRECALHVECTIGSTNGKGRIEGVQCCGDCGDYRALKKASDPAERLPSEPADPI